MLSERENIFWKCAMDCGLELKNLRGSFERLPAEPVWRDLSRWIGDGRFRTNRVGDEAASVAVCGGGTMDNGETSPV